MSERAINGPPRLLLPFTVTIVAATTASITQTKSAINAAEPSFSG